MYGPEILRRCIEANRHKDKFGNVWQYHSRSDYHSKVACWGLLLDVLVNCPLMRQHVVAGKVCFGINHELTYFSAGKTKNLDLVIATPKDPGRGAQQGASFRQLAASYQLQLTPKEQKALASVPDLPNSTVGTVLVAIESKACMTEHRKAGPRLFDELSSSQQIINGSHQQAVAGGLVVVNTSLAFSSTDRNKHTITPAHPPVVTTHKQPQAGDFAMSVVERLPRRSGPTGLGFDALGIVLLDLRNDGGPVRLVTPPAPSPAAKHLEYAKAVHRLSGEYAARWGHI